MCYEPMSDDEYKDLNGAYIKECFSDLGFTYGYHGEGNVYVAFEHDQWWLSWDAPFTDATEPLTQFSVVQANTRQGIDFEEL